MSRLPLILGVALAIAQLFAAVPASAVSATFVSGVGADEGSCTAAAPCATFQFAHNLTDDNGTITVVSSGSFGPLTINRSIGIIARGVTALIQTATADCGSGETGAAICVAALASDVIDLEGITIDLNSANKHGIRFNSGAALVVRNMTMRRLDGAGINFLPSNDSELHVSDSTFSNLGTGIQVLPRTNKSSRANIVRVQVAGAFNAIEVLSASSGTGASVASIRDSVVTGAENFAILALKGNGQSIDLMVDRTAAVHNNRSVETNGASTRLRIGNSTVFGNTKALARFGGGALTVFPGNTITGNGNDDNVVRSYRR